MGERHRRTRGRRHAGWAAVMLAVAPVGLTVAPPAASANAVPRVAPSSPAGMPVCQVRDSRLNEISGMAVTAAGFVVVNDSADEEPRRRIFFLDEGCRVTRTVRYPSRPRDTEDLAVGADGTVWIGDIGDNDRSRQTVAVWRLPAGGARPLLYRLTYPDGPHDAEALLLDGAGRPLIVTKQGGAAGIYAPARDLVAGRAVPLVRRGQVRLPGTDTSNPFGFLGRAVVTGAATSPDGRRVVLRTYADAFEFDVAGGDVVAALTGGTPRVVPLPDEPQGESIAYSRDGRSLLTVSEVADQPAGTRPTILRYPAPASPSASPPVAASSPPATPSASPAGAAPSDRDGRRGLLAVLLVGAGLAAAGLLAMLAARRARR